MTIYYLMNYLNLKIWRNNYFGTDQVDYYNIIENFCSVLFSFFVELIKGIFYNYGYMY